MKRIILWLESPSMHQAALVRALAARWGGEVVVATEADISERRLRSGWTRPDFAPARLVIAPSREERMRLLAAGDCAETTHVFSGLGAYPETYWTLRRAAATCARVGIYVERPAGGLSARGLARRAWYRARALRWARRLDFILAVGSSGVEWFRARGFRRETLFPFGYFTEAHEPGVDAPAGGVLHSREAVELLFVGQLIARKGPDLLLRALAGQPSGWRLSMVGGGPEEDAYRALARELGIGDRVRWLGTVPNDAAQRLMEEADVLVLPSRFDGWGAVASEALTRGTPVVVSDACGASDLVRSGEAGRVVAAGSVESLAAALAAMIARGPRGPGERRELRAWARDAISPAAAAGYLAAILASVEGREARPSPPWHPPARPAPGA